MLFRVATSLKVRVETGPDSGTTVIDAGEVVQLVTAFDRAAVARVVWNERSYAVDRGTFLSCTSPLGPAPD
jgi:hypothetical protein